MCPQRQLLGPPRGGSPTHGLDGDFVRPGGTLGLPCSLLGVTPGFVGVAVGVGVNLGRTVTVGVLDGVTVGVTTVSRGEGVVSDDGPSVGRSSVTVSVVAGAGVGLTFGRWSDCCCLTSPGNGTNCNPGRGPPSRLLPSSTR